MARKQPTGLAIQSTMIPDEWLVENGYAELAVQHAARPVFDSTGTRRIGHEDVTWARRKPGYDHLAALFHYEQGRPPPQPHYGAAAAQWDYKSPARKADREAAVEVLALTTNTTRMEVAA